MLTTQLALDKDPDNCFVFEHPSLGANRLPTWNGQTLISTALGWEESEPEKIEQVAGYLLWEDVLFFAPSDLLAGCFNGHKLCRYIQANLSQDARINVDKREEKYRTSIEMPIYLDSPQGILQLLLRPLDLSRLNLGSLKSSVEAFGGSMLAKGKMDAYKTDMSVPYLSEDEEVFNEYMAYGKDDACQLFFLRTANALRTADIFSVQGLEPPTREITTTGALVSELNMSHRAKLIGDFEAQKLFQTKSAKGNTREWELKDLQTRSSVEYIATNKKEFTSATLALVQGGMAKNMRPTLTSLLNAADNDILGYYASIQRSLVIPIGLPSIYQRHESNGTKMKLKQFLQQRKYGTKNSVLGKRLFNIVVSGTLNHSQNLVPSKVIETIDIQKKYNEDTCKIPADFRIYAKEIINGIITSDVLEILKNVCSNAEWKSWMNLDVSSAIWFNPQMRCNTPEEWYEKTLQVKNETGNKVDTDITKDGYERIVDRRSRYWLAVSNDEFLEKYTGKRTEYKAERDKHPKGSDKWREYDGKQTAMKLVGNVNYGVSASPLMPICNVVVANNITAAGRCGLWCMLMALNGVQGITDGCAYPLNEVRFWTNKKPSMNTCAQLRNPDLLGRNIRADNYTAPLGSDVCYLKNASGIVSIYSHDRPLEAGESMVRLSSDDRWELSQGMNGKTRASSGAVSVEANKEQWYLFDALTLQHVKDYFRKADGSHHGIDLLDNIVSFSHKHLYAKIAFQSQTNYQCTDVFGNENTKARGHKTANKEDGSYITPYNDGTKEAAIVSQLRQIGTDPTKVTFCEPQYLSSVLKINQANDMVRSAVNTPNAFESNSLLAGDSITKRSWCRPISTSQFLFNDEKQYQSWHKKHSELKEIYGMGLEGYFLNDSVDGEELSMNYAKAIVDIQDALDSKKTWISRLGGKGYKLALATPHPYKCLDVKRVFTLNEDSDVTDGEWELY